MDDSGKEPTLAESSSVSLRIPYGGFEDLAALAEYAGKLNDVLSLVRQSPKPADKYATAKFLSEKAGLSEAAPRNILDGLSTLRSLMVRFELTEEELLAAINSSIETQAPAGWKSTYRDKWMAADEQIRAALKAIPEDSPIVIYGKAKDLTYAHQHVLTDATLVTDLRPVFDMNADAVRAVVLTHVLTITFQDGTSIRRIEFAMDAGDVSKLQRISERAQKKTATIRNLMDEKRAWPLVVPGITTD